jgi:hypothetical protein
VNNIKMDLRERVWDGMDWSDLAQDRDQLRALVNSVIDLRVLYTTGKLLRSLAIGGF